MDNLLDFKLTQSDRMISIESTDLGVQKIVAISFEGVEQLSTLSSFRLQIVSLGRAIKPSEILGHKLGVALRVRNHVRHFNGIVSRLEMLQSSYRDHYLHVIDLVPPAWVLTLNQRFRIFHDSKSYDVISQVLNEWSLSFSLKSVGEQREYWVQYSESDFNFVSRLLEEEGLFYYFDHAARDCDLKVGNGSADYTRGSPETLDLTDTLETWQQHYNIGPSAFRHAWWDFKAVSLIDADVKSLTKAQPPGMQARNVFEYPGRHETDGEASRLATARMGERETTMVCVSASSIDCRVESGAKYKVKGQTIDLPGKDQTSDTFMAYRVLHRAHDGSLLPFGGGSDYANEFLCIPGDFDFRPPRVTPRPSINGPQTATVTETPDEFGRAKVKFHWEETETSRWVRVGQSWAYNTMGTQFFARVDSEVIVDYLGGDPDHPIIVGMVYNGKNSPPFDVPENKTQSGFRGANWDEAGKADKSNELRFEDKAGQEEIYIHAQKDHRRVVTNDDTLTVQKGNRTIKIETGYESTDAKQSITLTVGQSSIKLEPTSITIKSIAITIEGQASVDVKSPLTTVKGDGTLTLKGGVTLIN